MTNPAATQNKEIDCLSPEAQRLVREKHRETFASGCERLVLVGALRPRAAGTFGCVGVGWAPPGRGPLK